MNNGVYGSSYDDVKNRLKITLLRSPSYCAHPLNDRITMPQDRYMPYIEQGERDFSFAFDFGEKEGLLNKAAREALTFNMPPMMYSFYPTGKGQLPQCPVRLEETEVVTMNAFKKAENGEGYIIRLFNPTAEEQNARVYFRDMETNLCFGKYEIKTLLCRDGKIEETDELMV